MKRKAYVMAMAAGLMIAAAPASAQSGLGGLGGLLGGGLPDIASVGASNATGVLSYCVKNKFLSSTRGVSSVLGQLSGQKGVQSSDAFKLGETGVLQTGKDRFSLGGLKGRVKTMACDMVLKHAKSFL